YNFGYRGSLIFKGLYYLSIIDFLLCLCYNFGLEVICGIIRALFLPTTLRGTTMTQSASLFTINNVPISMELLLGIMWPSLLAALVPIALMLALLSFDDLIGSTKPFMDRVKSSPIANPFAWWLFGLSFGTFIFGTVFIALL